MPLSPAATEAERRYRVLSLIAAGLFVAELGWFWITRTLFNPWAQYTVLGTSVALVVLLWLQVRAALRGRTVVARAERMLCPRCGYVLTGIPMPGTCPECSTPFTESTLQREWEDAYRSYATYTRDSRRFGSGDE